VCYKKRNILVKKNTKKCEKRITCDSFYVFCCFVLQKRKRCGIIDQDGAVYLFSVSAAPKKKKPYAFFEQKTFGEK